MNATHLFEKISGDRSFPPCSESFWTTVFGFFLLHLSKSDIDVPTVTAWRPLDGTGPPYYERKLPADWLSVRSLTFQDLAIEPRTVMGIWDKVGVNLGGIAPDILLRLRRDEGLDDYALIENKITSGAALNCNQESVYPKLVDSLKKGNIPCRLFVLHSVGCGQTLFAQTKALQQRLNNRFGIILWEDVFRLMAARKFNLPGFDIQTLLPYTKDAEKDCRAW